MSHNIDRQGHIWYVAFGSNTVPEMLGRYVHVIRSGLSPDHDVADLEQHLQNAVERSESVE